MNKLQRDVFPVTLHNLKCTVVDCKHVPNNWFVSLGFHLKTESPQQQERNPPSEWNTTEIENMIINAVSFSVQGLTLQMLPLQKSHLVYRDIAALLLGGIHFFLFFFQLSTHTRDNREMRKGKDKRFVQSI